MDFIGGCNYFKEKTCLFYIDNNVNVFNCYFTS